LFSVLFMIIRKHKYRHVCVHSSGDFRRLYKSFLDHWLAALIRIFFRDYASSFTSAYFSSLQLETSWVFPLFPLPLLAFTLPSSESPLCNSAEYHHFHSSVCFLLFYQPGILTKVLEFVRQDTIRVQKMNKILINCRCLNFTQTNYGVLIKFVFSRFVLYSNCSKLINKNFLWKYLCANIHVSAILLCSRLYFDGGHKFKCLWIAEA